MRKRVRLGLQNVLNKYDHHSSSNSTVPVRPWHDRKSTVCMPLGSTILSTAPCGGWEGEEREKEKVRKEESGGLIRRKLYFKSSVQGTSFSSPTTAVTLCLTKGPYQLPDASI